MEIDNKDKRILYELDKNSRLSLGELSRKLRMSKEVIHYRINNLIKNEIILKFHTVPATYRFGLKAYKIYLRLKDLSKEDEEKIKEYLLNEREVFWFGTWRGRWDLVFGTWAKNTEDFFRIHDKVLTHFNKHIQEKELSISRENFQFNRRWFYAPKEERLVFNFGEKEELVKINEDDQKVLDELVKNSRARIIDIADQTKLSVDQVKYKIKKMENERIIKGYKILLNPRKMGFVTCKAFVFFKDVNPRKKEEFIGACKKLDNSINVITTFAPWDLEIMFETESYEKYYEIMEELKEKFKDIINYYESLVVVEEPKQIFKNL